MTYCGVIRYTLEQMMGKVPNIMFGCWVIVLATEDGIGDRIVSLRQNDWFIVEFETKCLVHEHNGFQY